MKINYRTTYYCSYQELKIEIKDAIIDKKIMGFRCPFCNRRLRTHTKHKNNDNVKRF